MSRLKTTLAGIAACIALSGSASAQDSVSISELPLLGERSDTLCGYINEQTQSALDAKTRAALEAELRRRGGFNRNDIRVLLRHDADVGFGMSLQGLRCALGDGVEVVHVWTYGPLQTWQVRLFNNFQRYTVGFAYMEGNGTASGMRVRSLI